jgi:hypothetical protein
VSKHIDRELADYEQHYDNVDSRAVDPEGDNIKDSMMTVAERLEFLLDMKDEHETKSACGSCPLNGVCIRRNWQSDYPWVMVTGCSQHPNQKKYKGHSTTVTITDTTISYGVYGNSGVYNTAWEQDPGTVYAITSIIAGQGSGYWIYRGGLEYNTSGIPGGASISNAKFISYVKAVTRADIDYDTFAVTNPTLSNPIVGADYHYIHYGAVAITDSHVASSLSIGAYNTWDNLVVGTIVKGGTTKFGLRNSYEISKTAPPGNDYFNIGSHTDANPPKLEVTYDVLLVSLYNNNASRAIGQGLI